MREFTHGTRYGWYKRCRCQECRDWKAKEMRRYRAIHPQPNGWTGYNQKRSYVNPGKGNDD